MRFILNGKSKDTFMHLLHFIISFVSNMWKELSWPFFFFFLFF